MRRTVIGLSGALALALLACGDGGAGPTGGDGGGDPDAGAALDAGPRDAGPRDCLPGQHPCGAACVDDLPDEPLHGCRLGCGEPCPAPGGGHATCSLAGECDFVCDAPFVRDGGGCRCAPATCVSLGAACGSVDDGCGGALECGGCGGGATCTGGACACEADAGEPNGTRATATPLGALTDRPDSSLTVDTYAIGHAGDEDWYAVQVTDAFDGGNPQITVTLSGIPAGSDYDLAIYYLCSGSASTCTAGTPITLMDGCASRRPGSADEVAGLSTECSGTDDSGLLLVHVTAAAWASTCAPYTLTVAVR